MAANPRALRPALVPGSYAGLRALAYHVSLAALHLWRQAEARDGMRILREGREARRHVAIASRAADRALALVEEKRNSYARDEVLGVLACDPPAQLRLLTEE
jgi:hypothetical protein